MHRKYSGFLVSLTLQLFLGPKIKNCLMCKSPKNEIAEEIIHMETQRHYNDLRYDLAIIKHRGVSISVMMWLSFIRNSNPMM